MAAVNPRLVVERFAENCARHLSDICAVAVLLPWSTSSRAPAGILAPKNAEGTLLDAAEITQATEGKLAVLVPAVFDLPQEQASAHHILQQFTTCENVCVFLVQLLPEGRVADREYNEVVIQRHDPMLATGADDVFMNPDPDPAALRRMIMLARISWQLNVRRMQLMLDFEPDPVSPEVTRALQAQHRRLLWDSIPRALMPHFKLVDKNLIETGHSVDRYRLVRRMETLGGTVLQATDEQNAAVAIKVIDKSKVCTPGELEGIYREFRFLTEIVKHPNIARCVNMLHSMTRVYLVFEFVGNQNLADHLSARPGQRLDEEDALCNFEQIGRGLAHCHSKDVAHRGLSLEHIVLAPLASDGFHCRIVDFRSAMVAKGMTTSRTVCGTLPCIAPEMASGGPYVPRLADCWSAGVVLLEMGGGLTSLHQSVGGWGGDLTEAGMTISRYFAAAGSQAKALGCIGAIKNTDMIANLEALLVLEAQRLQMKDVVAIPSEE